MKKSTKIIASVLLTSCSLLPTAVSAQNNGASLLKDANAITNQGSYPYPTDGVAVGNTYYFSGYNDQGSELYKTNGTTSGTALVKDIYPGSYNSDPNYFKAVGNTVFFLADDGENGEELWMTDGTSAGTKMVFDKYLGKDNSSNPNYLTVAGSYLFLKVYDESIDENVIYKVDASGSVSLVYDPTIANKGYDPSNLTAVGTDVFFQAYSNTYGYELWKTDGTAANTSMVKDINVGGSGSNPTNFTAVGTKLFFIAYHPSYGNELWESDGNSLGTNLVKDIVIGSGSNTYNYFTATPTKLFFTINSAATGTELWVSDGSSSGTTITKDLNPGAPSSDPYALIAMGSSVFFTVGAHPTDAYRLFKSDGTSAGTVLVSNQCYEILSNPVVVAGTTLYFGSSNAFGYELWKSDGNSLGTVMVKDIDPSGWGYPQYFGAGTSVAYFSANNGTNGTELFVTDGSSSGTMMLQIGTGLTDDGEVDHVVKSGNSIFFSANDGVHGIELWKSDGTVSSGAMVKDLAPGPGNFNFYGIGVFGGNTYVFGDDGIHGTELWITDGTSAGTSILDLNPGAGNSDISAVGTFANTFYFGGSIGGANGLYKTNGTTAGTQLVYGGFNSFNGNFFEANGLLYFAASYGANGNELWISDGNSANTKMLKDINPTGNSDPYNFVSIGTTVYFWADDGARGTELWKTDGTPAGTQILADINPQGGLDPSGYGTNMVALNNKLIFPAYSPANGYELWTSDGTFDGTQIVSDINIGSSWSVFQEPIIAADAYVYFNAYDPYYNDYFLYKSDGTSAGTGLVDTQYKAEYPYNLTAVGSLVAFVARDYFDNNDHELWISNGTAEGTVEVTDIEPYGDSYPDNIVNMSNDYLAFSAESDMKGTELWRYDLPSVLKIGSLGSAICAGSSIGITYTVTQGTLNSGNKFNVELSDGLGSFDSPKILATVPSTSTTGSIPVNVPSGFSGLGYKIRVSASDRASLTLGDASALSYIVADAPVTVWGNTSFCPGTPTTLTATGAVSYVWSGMSTGTTNTISVGSAGALTVTSTDAYGCTKNVVTTITQDVPPVVVVSGNTSYCLGSSTTLEASGAITYSWSPTTGLSDANAASVVVNGSSNQTYIVTGMGAACSTTKTVNTVVSQCGSGLGIAESTSNTIQVYPNPATETLHVKMDLNANTSTTIKLVNTQGMLVYSETTTQAQGSYFKTIDMSKQAKGIYWLQVITNQGTTTNKVIVE